MEWKGSEKRKSTRLANFNLPLKFQVGQDKNNGFWVLRDISSDGVRVELLILKDLPEFQINDSVPFSLTLSNPDYNINCSANVHRVYYEKRGNNHVCGLGLEFNQIDDKAKDYLNLFIEERSA